jgi:Flp pilus assembly pilin Flp
MLTRFWSDQGGFIVSAELVLIATLCVIGLIVGLSEVQHAVVGELNDVGDAIGKLNQSYLYTGFSKVSVFNQGVKAFTRGSFFVDTQDECDCNQCGIDCDAPIHEAPKFCGGNCAGW